MKPRTKAPKNEQLTGTLTGDLAAFVSEGLLQHPLVPALTRFASKTSTIR
jgi:hypothetical protein